MAAAEPLRKPALLRNREDYKVAIVVALPKEKDAVDAILEHPVSRQDAVKVSDDDDNEYDYGVLGEHHVVVTQLPGMGKGNAAGAAANMRRSFPNIKLCLLVGICGIVPVTKEDDKDAIERCLGDVVIAESIVQYDFGKGTEGGFVRKTTVMDVPGRPSTKVRNVLGRLRTWKGRRELEEDLKTNIEALLERDDIPPSGYPTKVADLAFPTDYAHQHPTGLCPTRICSVTPPCLDAQGKSCLRVGCEPDKAIRRQRHPEPNRPRIFVGSVGVADTVQKSAKSRDAIAAQEKVIAFEMESVGIWDHFPDVVVIKGACDYADSHKNDYFHRYASATSAACAKAFLNLYRLEGNVRPDESSISRARVGLSTDSHGVLSSHAAHGTNLFNGDVRGSTFGHDSTINNVWSLLSRRRRSVIRVAPERQPLQERTVPEDYIQMLRSKYISNSAFTGLSAVDDLSVVERQQWTP